MKRAQRTELADRVKGTQEKGDGELTKSRIGTSGKKKENNLSWPDETFWEMMIDGKVTDARSDIQRGASRDKPKVGGKPSETFVTRQSRRCQNIPHISKPFPPGRTQSFALLCVARLHVVTM